MVGLINKDSARKKKKVAGGQGACTAREEKESGVCGKRGTKGVERDGLYLKKESQGGKEQKGRFGRLRSMNRFGGRDNQAGCYEGRKKE